MRIFQGFANSPGGNSAAVCAKLSATADLSARLLGFALSTQSRRGSRGDNKLSTESFGFTFTFSF